MIVLTEQKDIDSMLGKSPLELAAEVINLEKDHINQDIITTDKDILDKIKTGVEILPGILVEADKKYKEEGGKTIGDLINEVLSK